MKNKAIAPFDIAIADEAHRTAGAVDALFSAFHDAGSVRANKRLYLTATPRVYEVDDSIAYSMDNEEIFGKIAHSLPLSRAIEKGLLCDYQVVVAAVSERDQELLASHDGISKRYALAEVALKRSLEKYHLRKVLTFHSRIHDAERIAAHLPAVVGDDTWVRTIKGNTPTATRTHLLKMFGEHQGTAILTNCKCLSEGVDVPSIDGIVFFDPRSSEIDVVQAVGRAIRLSSTKAVGTIVLPVMVPGNVDEEGFLSSTAFKPIVQVLKALRAHDDRIEGRFRVQAEKPSEMESVLRERHIHLDLGAISETLKAKITTKVISLGNGVRGAYLTEDAIREAGREYYKLYQKLPSAQSTEPVPGMETERWNILDAAGWHGRRGLDKGRTLARILEPLKGELGVDNTLTEDAIITAARAYYKLHAKLPNLNSTEPVPGIEGDSWRKINAAGGNGHRGLEAGRTLAKILEPIRSELGFDNTLTEEAIREAARAYHKLYLKIPTKDSTEPVPGMEGESWKKIYAAGYLGLRGLEKGRSLTKILEPLRDGLL
ncbi:MAG: hypothetical protein EBZ48_10215, partial [Proteobacteria bacterium]|nr:hypothetical protein [Pseudomonadota bacterium]